VLISLLSSRCRSAVVVHVLKSILGMSPKVKDSIENPFPRVVGLRVRVQGMTIASRVCECYYFVSSFVFLIMNILGLVALEWFFS